MTEPQLSRKERMLVHEIKNKLLDRLGGRLKYFVLFGSRARGDAEEHSDLDLAIVVENLDRSLKREILDVVADCELSYDRAVSSLVFSDEEFEHLRQRERRLALDILQEGIPL